MPVKFPRLTRAIRNASQMSLDGSNVDADLEKFLTVEKVKTQFHEQVHHITDICWDKCIEKPSSKLDSRSQACLVNCVERFLDASLMLTNRFAHLLQNART